MKAFKLFAMGLAALSCNSDNKTATTIIQTPHNSVVVAYVHNSFPEWGENYERLAPITHINFAFVNVRNGIVSEEYEQSSEKIKNLVKLKEIKPDLNLLVSLGGWSWSKGFSDASLTDSSREILSNSIINLVNKYGLDGIDIDWEYPAQIGDNNPYRPEDKENFTFLLKRIREKFDSLSQVNSKQYLLTIAAGAGKSWLDNTEMKKVSEYLDLINLMTYDFSGTYSDKTAHHANLFPAASDTSQFKRSAALSVQAFIDAGVPPQKITLGVPFYGKSFANVSDNALGSSFDGAGKGNYSWANIAELISSESNFVQNWDSVAQAPYLWDSIGREFVTFENQQSLALKTKFAVENELAGMMFWKYEHDNGTLIKVIEENLPKKK